MGPITVWSTMNTVESASERNQRGAETYVMIPVMNTARCAGCSPCHRNRRELMRFPWHQRRSRLSSSMRLGGISS